MRDIRRELQERASLFEEQINAHEAEFELMEIDVRRLSSAPAASTVQTREPVHPVRNSLPINRRSIRRINRRRSIHCISSRSIRRISRCIVVRTGRRLSRKSNPSTLLPTSWSAS